MNARGPQPPAPPAPRTRDVQALHTRVQALEARTFAPPAGTASDESLLHTSAPGETRSLQFSLAAGGPQKVRVTLDHGEVVLFGSWSTASKPRKLGDWVSVLIEVIGNPGDAAKINITNSAPTSLTSAPIPAGQTHIADPRVIEADWN